METKSQSLSAPLAALYQKLQSQGTDLVLTQDTAASQALVEQWKLFLHTEQLEIFGAVVSPQDKQGNFTVHGTAALLQFGPLPVEISFFASQEASPQSQPKLQCIIRALQPLSAWNIIQDYPNAPGYVDHAPANVMAGRQPSFLAQMGFSQVVWLFSSFDFGQLDREDNSGGQPTVRVSLTDPPKLSEALLQAGINFTASMATADEIWQAVKQITGDLSNLDVTAHLTARDDDLQLMVSHSFIGVTLDIGRGLSLALTKLIVRSGLTTNTAVEPGFAIETRMGSDERALYLMLDINIGSSLVSVQGSFGEGKVFTLADLAETIKLSDLDLSQQLPANTGESYFGALGLRSLRFALTAAPLKLDLLEFTIATSHPWTIIDDKLSVSPVLMFRIENPFDAQTRLTTLEIIGIWRVGQTTFHVYAAPLNGDIVAYMAPGETLDVDALVQQMLPGVALPEVTLVNMSLEANYLDKTFYMALEAAGAWVINLGPTTLEILDIVMEASYDQGRIADFRFAATLELATVRLRLDAEYLAGSGWFITGETSPYGQHIPIGTLIHDLGTRFGVDKGIPPAIAHLTLEAIGIVFNTAAKDFRLICVARFPLEEGSPNNAQGSDKAIDLALLIDLKHQQDGSYTKHFSGHLALAGLEFDLVFDEENQVTVSNAQDVTAGAQSTQTFLAAYRNPNGTPVPVDTLLQTIGIQTHTGLSFTLKEALLAYRRDASTTVPPPPARWLFGLDIDGGLDLSRLHLPDLPLVSDALPPGQALKLSFNLLAPSAPWTAAELAALNQLVSGGGLGLPARQLDPPIALTAALQIGDEVQQLSLPIGVAAQPAGGGGNGLVNDPAAAAGAGSAAAVSNDGVQWINIQKSFGPVQIARLGLAYQDSQIAGLLDASLSAGGLTLSLDGLTVRSPLSPLNPTFDLRGLGIEYQNGPLHIGGAFLRQPDGFAGLALIQTQALTLSAIGAYATIAGHPSFFIYAVLDYPLGGPAFFFVTGLAAGFGYNRTLQMPPIEGVKSFPLVAEAMRGGGPAPVPADPQGQKTRLAATLTQLGQYVPPAEGQNFLVAGIRFTSFKQINSFALLAVQFGRRFEIDLLGISTLRAPTEEEGGDLPPVAQAELALKATFIPDEGFLGVQAQLTANSFILSRDCHLTGGFAFYSWFSGPHSGDFVLTLGGYHPLFQVPVHYPQVPRLGFNWQVSPQFSLKGELYFALASHALMAGGRLEAIWQSDNIQAHFIAGADFLLAWRPYHYDISLFVSISVQVTVHFFGTHRFTLEAGANLHIWGPPFAGEAHAYVRVIGIKIPFDVTFGSGAGLARRQEWPEFQTALLPDRKQVCSITLQQGLIRAADGGAQLVQPKTLVLATDSALPVTTVAGFTADLSGTNTHVGVYPMGIAAGHVTITCTITVTQEGVAGPVTDRFAFTPRTKALPTALWGQPTVREELYIEPPSLNGPRFVEKTITGFEIRPKQAVVAAPPLLVSREALRYEIEPVPDAFRWDTLATADLQGEAAWSSAAATAVSHPGRATLLAALGFGTADVDFGLPVDQDVVF